MNIGTRELKNRLSYYLRRVREGETIRVTDRGKLVANLSPVAAERSNDGAILHEFAQPPSSRWARAGTKTSRPRSPAPAASAPLRW